MRTSLRRSGRIVAFRPAGSCLDHAGCCHWKELIPAFSSVLIAKKKPLTEVLKKSQAQHLNLQLADSDELGMAEHKHEITSRHIRAMALTTEPIRPVDAVTYSLPAPDDGIRDCESRWRKSFQEFKSSRSI